MQRQYGDDVAFLGIGGASTSAQDIAEFVSTYDVGAFPHVQDLDNEVWRRFDVATQPVFIFVDDDGSTERTGRLGEDGLTERVESLIAS